MDGAYNFDNFTTEGVRFSGNKKENKFLKESPIPLHIKLIYFLVFNTFTLAFVLDLYI